MLWCWMFGFFCLPLRILRFIVAGSYICLWVSLSLRRLALPQPSLLGLPYHHGMTLGTLHEPGLVSSLATGAPLVHWQLWSSGCPSSCSLTGLLEFSPPHVWPRAQLTTREKPRQIFGALSLCRAPSCPGTTCSAVPASSSVLSSRACQPLPGCLLPELWTGSYLQKESTWRLAQSPLRVPSPPCMLSDSLKTVILYFYSI